MQFEHQACILNGVGKWKMGSGPTIGRPDEEVGMHGETETTIRHRIIKGGEREQVDGMDSMAMKNSEIQF